LKQAGVKKPYLLHVGGNQPYKNRAGAIEAFAALEKAEAERYDYVMAGKALPQHLQERIQELGLEKRIKRLVMPTDEQINILYSNAEALVYPSLTEGFGLPLIEAATVDCPVVTSNRPPMSEIVEPEAPKFDPTSPDDVAATVLEALKDRAKLIELGRRSLQRFQKEDVLKRYAEIYRSLAG
jgi:glycosyltransferase involved in cell wall biosynthesis